MSDAPGVGAWALWSGPHWQYASWQARVTANGDVEERGAGSGWVCVEAHYRRRAALTYLATALRAAEQARATAEARLADIHERSRHALMWPDHNTGHECDYKRALQACKDKAAVSTADPAGLAAEGGESK